MDSKLTVGRISQLTTSGHPPLACSDDWSADADDLRAQVDKLRAALAWYGGEARALAKHMNAGEHSQAVRAALTALSADGGRRADACLGPKLRAQLSAAA